MLRYRCAVLRGVQPQIFGVFEIESIAVESNRSRSNNSVMSPVHAESVVRSTGHSAER